jgi:hypothetical protein
MEKQTSEVSPVEAVGA